MMLWIIVVVMAVALAAEIFALAGMAIVAFRAARFGASMKNELTEKLQPSIRMIKELSESQRPSLQRVREDGGVIVRIVGQRFHAIGVAWQDAHRRIERLRVRLGREGVASVGQIERDRRFLHRGVVIPMRKITSVALGIRSAAWLLRKVA